MMNVTLKIVFLSVTIISVMYRNYSDQFIVDYYVNLIADRTQKALDYKFPKDARMHEPKDKVPKDYGEHDMIIIGGGSTGCVIANRLSEVYNWKVLLLEAGSFPDEDLTGIPALSGLDAMTKFNWGFESVPQKNSFLGNVDHICWVPRGKGIGGTSLINGMAHTRGNKLDFDKMADLLDDPGWSYDNLLPYFLKSENFTKTNPFVPFDRGYHNFTGPLVVTESVPPQEASINILKGSQELGYNVVDTNGRQQLGASVFQFNLENGLRFDPGKAFLEPIKYRKNLKVLANSYVTKIKISERTRKAEGVYFTKNNRTYYARTRKEVILSAGTISSPQILMLSGIGPRDDLESLGIPVIQDLPVGQFLRDHPYTILPFSTNITSTIESTEKQIRDLLKGRGALTLSHFLDAVLFLQTPVEKERNYPDVEFTFTNISDSELIKKSRKWTDETYDALNVSVPQYLSITFFLLHSKSYGTIKLKSADPFEYPLIDLNLLSDEENHDLESLYQGVQLVLKLLETEAFRKMNVKLAFEHFPGCNHTEPLSREYWYCYFRRVTGLGSHQVATCLAGRSPRHSVVNNELKVFGIDGLRVADASIFPFPITGHTTAPCTMVGEKVSDLIKDSHQ